HSGLEAFDGPLIVSNSMGGGDAPLRAGGWENAVPDSWETLRAYSSAALVARAASELKLTGRVEVIGNTCAAGNYAIGAAMDAILRGDADVVLAAGMEELSLLGFAAFSSLRAIGDPCRPFDTNRNGLLFGEGAACLVLESLDHARARGAAVLAEVVAVGYSNDAHHLLAPHPEGAGLELALRRCMDEGELASVDYVNAHGTGTPANDAVEAETLARVLGPVPVSSTKGGVGHCMGGASAVEAVLTVESMRRGELLPNVGLAQVDPMVPLPVIESSRSAPVEVALSAGLGFGGNNAVLALRRSPSPRHRLSRRPVYLTPAAAVVGTAFGLRAVLDALRYGHPMAVDAEFDPKELLGRKGLRHADRGAVLFAAAMASTEIDGDLDRLGASVGGSLPAYAGVNALLRAIQRGGVHAGPPTLVPFATVNCLSSWWLSRVGGRGFNGCTLSGDCAGLDAILLAAQQIECGRVDRIVAGATEGRCEESWRALAGRYRSPFVEGTAAVWVSSAPAGMRKVGHSRAFGERATERVVDALGSDTVLFARG
ncbi:MAG: beta-ketoacyl synthase N-terminal-like domain-containing protein, partial [Myxococcota bacterium]